MRAYANVCMRAYANVCMCVCVYVEYVKVVILPMICMSFVSLRIHHICTASDCGHSFCKRCVKEMFERDNNQHNCPLCGALLRLSPLIPNIALHIQLSETVIFCRYGLKPKSSDGKNTNNNGNSGASMCVFICVLR